jgi:hypothetical protein
MQLSGLSDPPFNGARSVSAVSPETERALAKESSLLPNLPGFAKERFPVSLPSHERVLSAGVAAFPCQTTHLGEWLPDQ